MKRYLTPALASVLLMLVIPVYGQETEQEPIPIPINQSKTETEERDSRAARSFSNAVAHSERNHFGFSLSASEGRISDVYPDSSDRHPSMLTGFGGGIFANYGWHKSSFHMDAKANYRIYHQADDMDGGDYSGGITYAYKASRKTRYEVSDQFSSSWNDPFSNFNAGLTTTVDSTSSPSYAVVYAPQRFSQNVAKAQMSVEFSRSTHFNVFGSLENYLYGDSQYANSNGIQTGAGLDQRIKKWMYFSSSYSYYLNRVDERLRDTQIHNIEIARFRFLPSSRLEIYFSVGIDVADDGFGYHTNGSFRAGISRSFEKNVLYASYQRTMTSAVGYARVLPSDQVTVGFGQRLTRRTNLQISGDYIRSSDFYFTGNLISYDAQVQFEYALRSDLFISANYAYEYQKNAIPSLVNIPHYDRSVIFVRLQYTWPSIRLKT